MRASSAKASRGMDSKRNAQWTWHAQHPGTRETNPCSRAYTKGQQIRNEQTSSAKGHTSAAKRAPMTQRAFPSLQASPKYASFARHAPMPS